MSSTEAPGYDPERLPGWSVRAGYYFFLLAISAIIFGLTAYTYQLDDIKVPLLLMGGSASLVIWAALWMLGRVETPPRELWIPTVAFLALNVVSTVVAKPVAHWVGWWYVKYYIASFGLTLLISSVIQTRRMVDLLLRFWVAISLATTIFGLIHYAGVLEPIYQLLYPNGPPYTEDRFHDLMYTFMRSRSMISTILNVQFFGNFLLMLIPMQMACIMMSFRDLRQRVADAEPYWSQVVWLGAAGLAFGLSIACVWTTFSKTGMFLLVIPVAGFIAGVVVFAGVRRIPFIVPMVMAGLLMAATLLYFTWADLMKQLTSVEDSWGPRKLIFSAAWRIFLDNPIFGAGPGSFRIFFQDYRSPDYHLTRIANVTVYAHNWLLDFLAENGITGTLAFVAMLVGLGVLGWKAVRTCPDIAVRGAVVGSILGVVCLLLGSSITPMSRWPIGTACLHAITGSAFGIVLMALRPSDVGRKRKADADKLPDDGTIYRRGGLFIATLAVFLFTVYTANTEFSAAYYHNEGLKKTDLPESLFGKGGIAEDPRVRAVLQEGVEAFQKSLLLDPTRNTTYYKLANAYNRLGDPESAMKTYLTLQEYNPDYSEIHFNLAVLRFESAGRIKKEYDAAKKKGDSTAASSAYARMVTEYRAALASFARAAKLSNKIPIHYYYGNAMLSFAEDLEDTDPEKTKAFADGARIFERVSTLPITTVIDTPGQEESEERQRFDARRLARDAYDKAGLKEDGARLAVAQLKVEPTSFRSLATAVRLFQDLGQFEKGEALMDAALKVNPLNPDVHMLRLAALQKENRPDDVVTEGKFILLLNKHLKEQKIDFLSEQDEKDVRMTLQQILTPGVPPPDAKTP